MQRPLTAWSAASFLRCPFNKGKKKTNETLVQHNQISQNQTIRHLQWLNMMYKNSPLKPTLTIVRTYLILAGDQYWQVKRQVGATTQIRAISTPKRYWLPMLNVSNWTNANCQIVELHDVHSYASLICGESRPVGNIEILPSGTCITSQSDVISIVASKWHARGHPLTPAAYTSTTIF